MVFQASEDENKKKQNRVIMVIDYSKSSSQPDSIMSVKVPLSPKWQQQKKPSMDAFKDHRTIKLSKGSQDIYNKLSNGFKDWKTRREKLVETLKSSTKALERNSALVSSFRILTSAADMFGNLTKNSGRSENSRAALLMGTATTFGVGALLVEKLYYTKALNDIERAIAKDRESYKKCIEWYEETKELDKVVKSIFPYDIDTDIAQQINKGFSAKNDYEKLFMTILASNGKRNLKLLRDEEFLKAANFVATTEAGKLWYHKTISKDVLFFESDRYKEIRQILRLFQTEDRDVFLESCKSFSSNVNMKTAIDVISITSCVNNILYGARSDASEIVENFIKSTEEECKKLQKIVSLLKPPEAETEMDEVVVHKPKVGESLREYLQRYTSDQRQRIFQNKTKLEEFSATLVNTGWREVKAESIEENLEKLWKIHVNNFRRLLHFIEMFEPVRRNLLDSLNNYGDVIGKISKWCAAGRILSSAVDNAGTLVGLYLVDTKSSSDNWALGVATIFGFLGVMCSVSEAKMSSDAFNDVMEKLNTDQKFMAPIQKWYQQSPELEEKILNIFPFGFTNTILNEFISTGEDKQLNPSKLLSNLLLAMKDLKINGSSKKEEEESDGNAVHISSDKDEEGSAMHQDGKDGEEMRKLIENLILFAKSKRARELYLSLSVQHNTILLDATRKAFEQKNLWVPICFTPFKAHWLLHHVTPMRFQYHFWDGLVSTYFPCTKASDP